MGRRNRRKNSEIAFFREILLERRRELQGDVTQMEGETLQKSRLSASGDLSSVPFHMADIGTDNYEQEFALGLIQNEEDELREIDAALARLESGTYGACEACTKDIRKSRLKVIPYARLCIECKRAEEQTRPSP